MKTMFLRALEPGDKKGALLEAIHSRQTAGPLRFEIDPVSFSTVPGSPFSYWVSDRIRALFRAHEPFEQGDRIVRQGGVTGNDGRFLRLHWEVATQSGRRGLRWVPFAKGGSVSPWYVDYPVVVAWDERRGTFFGYTGLLHRSSEKPSSADHYFRSGLTWPLRASRFAPVPLPRGAIFSIRGYAILAAEEKLLSLEAIGNSAVFDYIFKVALGRFGFPEFVVGVLQKLPLPTVPNAIASELTGLARRAWSLKRSLDTRIETSHAFVLPALLQVGNNALNRAGIWNERARLIDAELASIQAKIDQCCFSLYDVDDSDQKAIFDGQGGQEELDDRMGAKDPAEEPEEHEAAGESNFDAQTLMIELVSWAVGVAFGRFDIRLATGDRAIPPEPEPFEPLPANSPGVLPDAALSFMPCQGVLVDDPGHAKDIIARVTGVYEHVSEEPPELEELRRTLARDFFTTHIKLYSSSRRKAPIYWQLATPSASYSVWLYVHAFTKDTLFQVQNDFVAPKLAHERRQLENIRTEAGPNPGSAHRKVIAAKESFIEELQGMLDDVGRAAPLWNPNLDDGVIINFSPLWRLVPQNRSWQKELKATWDDLCAGEYDWAHLAMHLWPERVVLKCVADRSLAIAHDLENDFWVEGLSGAWLKRVSIDETIEYLEKSLTSEKLQQTVNELEEFWKDKCEVQDKRAWWSALASGDHDEHPLALALWPERVLSRALDDVDFARRIGVLEENRKIRSREQLRRRYPPRHSEAELSILASFFVRQGDWARLWADLHSGAHDVEPLARFVYPERVVARSQDDYEFACRHDLARWFWLSARDGLRRLKEPAEEQTRALKERESPAVKAALNNLLGAVDGAAKPGRGQRRSAVAGNGGGR